VWEVKTTKALGFWCWLWYSCYSGGVGCFELLFIHDTSHNQPSQWPSISNSMISDLLLHDSTSSADGWVDWKCVIQKSTNTTWKTISSMKIIILFINFNHLWQFGTPGGTCKSWWLFVLLSLFQSSIQFVGSSCNQFAHKYLESSCEWWCCCFISYCDNNNKWRYR